MPLAHMPERYMLRDSEDYDYEYYDDDDYFDDDDGKVCTFACPHIQCCPG